MKELTEEILWITEVRGLSTKRKVWPLSVLKSNRLKKDDRQLGKCDDMKELLFLSFPVTIVLWLLLFLRFLIGGKPEIFIAQV